MKKLGKIGKIELSTSQVILIAFLCAILVGSALLTLPFASASGQITPYVDALFTSTTSVCVTGLVVVNTFDYWSIWGQIIILVLIQCGGLGIVTFTTSVMMVIGKKVSLKDRLLIQDAFNLDTLSGLLKFLKKVVKGTFFVELMGALCYMLVFIPEFGVAKGIWVSVFNAVSSFCNAGIDIIGPYSLAPYAQNIWINIVTILLIVLGGIGFIVWWDVIRVLNLIRKKEISRKEFFKKLSLHSKVVLTTTGILIVGGMVIVFLLEFNNPKTLGPMSFGNKIIAALFQSVTTRTAGFFTISQKDLRDSTALLCIILMFIGGSPVGTAGGVKTATIALIFIATAATIKGREEASAFNRAIPLKTIRKALAVVLISMLVFFMATMCLLTVMPQAEFVDVAFETASALGTTGLSRDFTAGLNMLGKIIIITCMYLGRIGPISMVIAFNFKRGRRGLVTFPEEDITVG